MVEMVIVLPILLVIVFSIVEFGIAFARWQVITNAAREGARAATVFRPSCDAGEVAAEVKSVVVNYATAVGMDVDDLGVTVEGVCGVPNSLTTVSVKSEYTFQFLPNLSNNQVSSTMDLVGKSVMRNGG